MLARILRMLNLRRDHNPGRDLANIRFVNEKARKRALVDQMRREMGLPAVEWPPL